MSSRPPRTQIPAFSDLRLTIDTARLHLRPLRPTDAEPLYRYSSDPELTKFVTWASHDSIEHTREWLAANAEAFRKNTDMVWAIVEGGEPCGAIGLHAITWGVRAVRWDCATLGYWLAIPHQGSGLGTEAAEAVTRWGFETLGLHKINVSCFEGNLGSKRVIEKVGFRFLCKCDEDVWRDGQWHAHLRYEMTASEWALRGPRTSAVVP